MENRLVIPVQQAISAMQLLALWSPIVHIFVQRGITVLMALSMLNNFHVLLGHTTIAQVRL